jgi:hypothetical protein
MNIARFETLVNLDHHGACQRPESCTAPLPHLSPFNASTTPFNRWSPEFRCSGLVLSIREQDLLAPPRRRHCFFLCRRALDEVGSSRSSICMSNMHVWLGLSSGCGTQQTETFVVHPLYSCWSTSRSLVEPSDRVRLSGLDLLRNPAAISYLCNRRDKPLISGELAECEEVRCAPEVRWHLLRGFVEITH